MDLNDIDYQKRMLAIASFLDGHPFNMYKKNMESEKTISWSEFKNMLRQMFGTTNKDLDIRIKLRNLKQDCQSSNSTTSFLIWLLQLTKCRIWNRCQIIYSD